MFKQQRPHCQLPASMTLRPRDTEDAEAAPVKKTQKARGWSISPLGTTFFIFCSYKTQEDNKNIVLVKVLRGVYWLWEEPPGFWDLGLEFRD